MVEISSGNQHSLSAKRNWMTNSPPYGYGGLRADMIVFPVRIIMSPTCSSRFFVGRNARSATARTTEPPLPGCSRYSEWNLDSFLSSCQDTHMVKWLKHRRAEAVAAGRVNNGR